jgi:ABC-2 type transport system permease protein
MVGILIRMKVAVLRHSMSGQQASETISGVSLGLVVAAGTIFFGGGDQTLRPEYFMLLPIPSRRLAMGLFSAAFVGAGALVTLVAFTSLVVYGARLGVGSLIVDVPAALLQLAVIILLSRWVTEMLNEVMRSQTGAALGAFISAAIIALFGSGWALAPTISQALTQGFPPAFSVVVRALPSGWGLVAVDAASRSHWLLAIGVLSGQAALIGLLLVGWSALLVRRTTKKTARPSKSGMVVLFRHRLLATTAVGAVIGKELRNWLRDPMRMHYLYFSLLYALLFCLLPLAVGILIFLPWTAALFIVMAAMITNFYGTDGSALWLTLVTPGAERSDVRGRQGAWGLLVAPTPPVLTIVLTTVSGQSWAWPWVLAMTPALLGGAAGLVLLISVFYLVPRTEPHLRSNNTLQAGSNMGQAILLLVLVPITAVPALAVVITGALQHNALLQWAGVGVGIITGAFFTWWLGRLAYRRLETRGPERLQLMRSGSSTRSGSRGASGFLSGLSAGKRQVVMLCLSFCWIPLVPQGIVPMVMKLSGNRVPSWFLALYLPEPYQWPTIFAMIALGSGLLAAGHFIIQREKKEQQQRKSAE